MHLRCLWLTVLMIGATCPVWAASTWHVATTGSGSSCTAVAPCNQVSTGVSKMTTSDTLIIHAGTYGGSTAGNLKPPSGVSGAFTTIKNQPGEVVRLRPNSIGIDCILCLDLGRHHIKLDGLILDGGDTSGSLTNKSTWLSAFPILDNNQHTLDSVADITITNSEILRGRHSGFLVAGIRWTITNNDVHHNGTEGLQSPTPDHGLYYSARNGTLDNNLIRDNDCYGIQNYSSVGLNVSGNVHTRNTYFNNGCGGITIENNNNGVFANNVVYNNAPTGATQAVLAGGNNGKIFYNTIVDNTGTTGIASQGGSPTSGLEMRNNIVCGNGSNIGSMGSAVLSNNVTTCPSFVNRGGRDFHLTKSEAKRS